MKSRSLQMVALLCASWMIAACDQGRKNPPDVFVRVVNAASSYDQIHFTREVTDSSVVQAQSASERFVYDVDQYDFHLDMPMGGSATRVSFSPELHADMHYAFVLTDVGGGVIEPVVLEYAPLDAAASGAQGVLMHAAGGFPEMSVYIEPPGTDITAATPRATLAFGQSATPVALPAGDLEITLTESGNPANVMLTSSQLTLPAATTTIIVITDGADAGISDLVLLVVGDAASVFVDRNVQSELRILNAANDGAPRDVALNGEFAPPLFQNVPFGTESAYAPIPAGENTVDVTPAGNPGVIELTQTITGSRNFRHTLILTGDSGALTHAYAADDRRRLAHDARMRVFNVAAQFGAMEFYFVPPGTDVTTTQPLFVLNPPSHSVYVTAVPGTYDLVLRTNGNIVAGPQTITIAPGGLYEYLAVNGPDTASAQIIPLEDGAAPAP